ncbi:MAG: hypothetical protein QUS09_05170, partial [Methanotrichaceae archaeon]|nr:hypothetical protein [Methanotrichaceae archaeon]
MNVDFEGAHQEKNVKIYLSGPIFSQAEIEWARQVKGLIETSFAPQAEVIWPHEIASGSPENIFRENMRCLLY